VHARLKRVRAFCFLILAILTLIFNFGLATLEITTMTILNVSCSFLLEVMSLLRWRRTRISAWYFCAHVGGFKLFSIVFPICLVAQTGMKPPVSLTFRTEWDDLYADGRLVMMPTFGPTTDLIKIGNRVLFSSFSGIRELDLGTEAIKQFVPGVTPGLTTRTILDIEVDSHGVIWFGSEDGLVRWDQQEWTVFTTVNSPLPSNVVRSLKADSAGIWIGTYNGVIYYNDGEWETFDYLNAMLPEKEILAITLDKHGNKWLGTWGGGVVRFNGLNATIWNMNGLEFVTGIAVDSTNNVWVATYAIHENGDYQGGGLHRYNGEIWIVYHPDNSELPSRNIRTIAVDMSNVVWLAMFDWYDGRSRGLATFNGMNWQKIDSSNSALSDNDVSAIFVDEENNKWLGIRKGIEKFDSQTWSSAKAYFSYGTTGLPIVVDEFDREWTADTESLVMIETGQNQTGEIDHFLYKIFNSPYQLLPSTFAVDSTEIFWIGGNHKLIQFDGRNWAAFDSSVQPFLEKMKISEIEVDRMNNKWILLKHPDPDSTRTAFLRYDNSSWQLFTLPNWVGRVTSFAVDQTETLWIGTTNGLVNFDGTTTVLYDTLNSGLTANFIRQVFVDEANVKWLSVVDYNLHGVVRYDGSMWDFYSTHHPNDPEYIPNIARCFAASSSGTVWIGTDRLGAVGTIMKFEDNSLKLVLDFYSGPVLNLSIDRKNDLWLSDYSSAIWVYFDAFSSEVDHGHEPQRKLPETFTLYQNYPNPFNSATAIEFTLLHGGYTELMIYDILGTIVRVIERGFRDRGNYRVTWDGKDEKGRPVSNGIYYCLLSFGTRAKSQKMILLR
jgi:ligand-binding sensor domain-containing protein